MTPKITKSDLDRHGYKPNADEAYMDVFRSHGGKGLPSRELNWRSSLRLLRMKSRALLGQARNLFAECAQALRSSTQRGHDQNLLVTINSQVALHTKRPRLIRVELREGVVTLRGPIAAGEVGKLMASIEDIPGVNQVIDQLETDAEINAFWRPQPT